MDSIIVYPKDNKQKSLLKSLLKEMKIRYDVKESDETLLSEEDFFHKIDKSIKQAESGETKKITKQEQEDLLGL